MSVTQAHYERSLLPQVLIPVFDVAGAEAVLALVKAHGGTRVTVPMATDRDNWLTRLVAPGPAAAIIDVLGAGCRVDLPLASRWRKERQSAALDMLSVSAGKSAQAQGITERAVRGQRARRLKAKRTPPTTLPPHTS